MAIETFLASEAQLYIGNLRESRQLNPLAINWSELPSGNDPKVMTDTELDNLVYIFLKLLSVSFRAIFGLGTSENLAHGSTQEL